jgi:integrase
VGQAILVVTEPLRENQNHAQAHREGSYVPHGLRATAAVRLIEAGCSEDQAASITGHRDLNVLCSYVRGANQAKLARQAIRKQEVAG